MFFLRRCFSSLAGQLFKGSGRLDGATIFALATPPGVSAVAVIRISGLDASMAIRRLCPKFSNLSLSIPPRKLMYSPLFAHDRNVLLDRGMVVHFPAPHSPTGEDVVELHLHGSLGTVHGVLDELGTIPGFSPAGPGDFSRRAFQHGKMTATDVLELEAVLHAETPQTASLALQSSHQAMHLIHSWEERITAIQAAVAAELDFGPDYEETQTPFTAHHLQIMRTLLDDMQTLLRWEKSAPSSPAIHMVLVGPPNVGKSSLCNRLTSRQAVLVSPMAGTTRDSVLIPMGSTSRALALYLVDTAGLRASTQDAIESLGMEATRRSVTQAQICLLLGSHDIVREDMDTCWDDISAHLPDSTQLLLVAHKSDLLVEPTEQVYFPEEALQRASHRVMAVSSFTAAGLQALQDELSRQMEALQKNTAAPALLAHSAIRSILEETHDIIDDFMNKMPDYAGSNDPEAITAFLQSPRAAVLLPLLSEVLQQATQTLGRLSGDPSVESLLSRVFSNFCIGK